MSRISNSIPFSLLVSFLMFVAASTAAADALRGRTVDGRAYRVDQNGNQIIDYIAELELSIEAKDRQLSGLEREVREKQVLIDRLRSGRAAVSGVEERDLLGGTEISSGQPEVERSAELQSQLATYKEEINRLTGELAVRTRELTVARSDLQIEQQIAGVESGSLRGDIGGLQKQIESRDSLLKVQEEELSRLRVSARGHEALAERLAEVEADLKRVRAEKGRLEEEFKVVTIKLLKTEEELKARGDQQEIAAGIQEAAQPAENKSEARASLRVVSAKNPRSKVTTRQNGLSREQQRLKKLEESRNRAVDTLRGKLRTDLNRVRALVQSRDKLYKKFAKTYNPKETGLSFRPSRPISVQKRSLAAVQKGIEKAKTVFQLTNYRNDIRQIQAKMSDDIGLMKRLGKKK